MFAKVFVAVCSSVLLLKTISAQCINPGPVNFAPCGSSLPNFGSNIGSFSLNSNGGGLSVSSTSPISPSGISVISENTIEGPLLVTGQLPILAAVAVEGQLPTSGSVSTTYSCGNGNVGIENVIGNGNGYANANGLGAPVAGNIGAGNIGANIAGPRLAPGCGFGGY